MVTPMDIVKRWKAVPGAFRSLDNIADAKRNGELQWDDRCPIPIGASLAFLSENIKTGPSAFAAEMTAAWAWNKTRISYIFDPDLAESLSNQAKDMKDTDVLPAEIISHLPYPCIYISSGLIFPDTSGFFAWVENDYNTDSLELRAQFLMNDGATMSGYLHLLPDSTLGQCIADAENTVLENAKAAHINSAISLDAARHSTEMMLKALQLILYLVSEDADIQRSRKTKKRGKSKKSPKTTMTEMLVGVRIGSAFRQTRQREGERQGKSDHEGRITRSPHMRRGHWHRYWTGPKSGERKLIIKWTAPVAIHGEKKPAGIVTEIPVKDFKN